MQGTGGDLRAKKPSKEGSGPGTRPPFLTLRFPRAMFTYSFSLRSWSTPGMKAPFPQGAGRVTSCSVLRERRQADRG